MAYTFVHDNDISPIYMKLYNQVYKLPAIDAIKERMTAALLLAKSARVTYKENQYGGRVEAGVLITLRHKTQRMNFIVSGAGPGMHLQDEHLVTSDEIFKIYTDNVGRVGKPIRPHGLVQLNTVLHGAAPRNKNSLSPWVMGKLFREEEYKSAKKRTEQRLADEIMAKLTGDQKFVDFSETVSTKVIVDRLKEYSHLPPSLLHHAVDLMYVETTMEG